MIHSPVAEFAAALLSAIFGMLLIKQSGYTKNSGYAFFVAAFFFLSGAVSCGWFSN